MFWSTLRLLIQSVGDGVKMVSKSEEEDFSEYLEYDANSYELVYNGSPRNDLYWSLPKQFLGNKVYVESRVFLAPNKTLFQIDSHGGNLTIYQTISDGQQDDAHVIIIGNDIALHSKSGFIIERMLYPDVPVKVGLHCCCNLF